MLLPFMTKYLAPEEYGVIDLITMSYVILSILIGLELTQAVSRFYPEAKNYNNKPEVFVSTAFWFYLVVYIFAGMALVVFRERIFPYFGLISDYEMSIVVIWVVLSGMYGFSSNQLKWEFKVKWGLFCSLIHGLLSSVITVILLVFFEGGVISFFIGQVIGCSVAFSLGVYACKDSYIFAFDYQKLKVMCSYSIPLIFSSISVFVSTYVDRVMITKFLGLEDLGYYGVAFRIASLAFLVMGAFQMAVTPLIYKYSEDVTTPKEISQVFSIFCAMASLILIGSVFFGKTIILLVLNNSYEQSAKIFPYMMIYIFLGGMYIFSPGISLAKKTRLIAVITIFGALLNTILNYISIPIFGFYGAIYSSIFVTMLVFITYSYAGSIYYSIPYEWKNLIIILLLTITSFIIINMPVFEAALYAKILVFFIVTCVYMYVFNIKSYLGYTVGND